MLFLSVLCGIIRKDPQVWSSQSPAIDARLASDELVLTENPFIASQNEQFFDWDGMDEFGRRSNESVPFVGAFSQ